MKKGKIIISFIVIGCLILSLGGGVFAYTTNAKAVTKGKMALQDFQRPCDRFKEITSAMVKDGTLTQEKADKIVAYLEKKQAEAPRVKKDADRSKQRGKMKQPMLGQRTNMLDEMVTAGIITTADADAIKAKMKVLQAQNQEQMKAKRTEMMTTQLNTLVTARTINADQAKTIISYMKQKQTERKSEMDKLKGMNKEQIKAYFDANKESRKDMMSELVSNGTLTQAQADAVKKVLHNNRPGFDGRGGRHKGFPGHKGGAFGPMGGAPDAPQL